jgi:transmembrane sensor
LLRGEAVFEVARDPQRPFQVYAGSGRVEALGTSFLVKALDRRLELTVTEGRVRLDKLSYEEVSAIVNLDSELYEHVFVDQGQQVVMDRGIEPAVMLDKSAIAKQTAWIDGNHIFQNDSLNYIAQELSRHSRRTIIISDPVLGEMKMGGVFKLGEIDAFISALKVLFNVEVDRVAEDLIYVRRQGG